MKSLQPAIAGVGKAVSAQIATRHVSQKDIEAKGSRQLEASSQNDKALTHF